MTPDPQELKELLTLAAKACGKDTSRWSDDVADWRWRPDLGDGDNARMEATVRIEVEWHSVGVASSVYNDRLPRSWVDPVVRVRETYTDHNGDEQAARRWASMRAAAQIGRGMP